MELFQVKIVVNDTVALEILLVANSVDLPMPKGTVQFVCPVRTQMKKEIIIKNP